MAAIRPLDRFLPRASVLSLLASLVLVATAVARWSAPPTGPTLAAPRSARRTVRTGSLAYPREAVDNDGFLVRIPAPPRRIVSQYWSLDEYLYSVVPPDRVVGVSESAFVPGVSNVMDLVRAFRPVMAGDAERVLRQNPDLILVAGSSRSDFTGLIRTSSIPVFRVFDDFTTLEQIEEYTRLVGYLTGEDARAASVAQRFHDEVQAAAALRSPNPRAPRVLGCSGPFGYGAGTLMDDVLKKIGAVNVAAQNGMTGYDAVNAEQIARWNPDWIVTSSPAGQTESTRKRLLADPGIALTAAGRTGQILILEDRVFMPMSPFASTRVRAIADAIHQGRPAR